MWNVSPATVFPFFVTSHGTFAIFLYVVISGSRLRLRKKQEREAQEPHRYAEL